MSQEIPSDDFGRGFWAGVCVLFVVFGIAAVIAATVFDVHVGTPNPYPKNDSDTFVHPAASSFAYCYERYYSGEECTLEDEIKYHEDSAADLRKQLAVDKARAARDKKAYDDCIAGGSEKKVCRKLIQEDLDAGLLP